MAEVDDDATLSQHFDRTYEDFRHIVSGDRATTDIQDDVKKTIKRLEGITVNVSELNLFSKNESFSEMSGRTLKFLLLPYMLGTLWQLSTKEKRKMICDLSKIYFRDFLKRAVDYELLEEEMFRILVPPQATEGETSSTTSSTRVKLTPDDRRKRKIVKYKENKELDEKIRVFRSFVLTHGDSDDSSLQEGDLFTAVLKRAINDCEEQLQTLEEELKLIKFHDMGIEGGEEEGSGEGGRAASSRPRQPVQSAPLRPFILTKDAAQKAVYGIGYPALPVMSVEELYQQRRETGQWGPPPSSHGHGVNQQSQPTNEEEDAEAYRKELLEDKDDDEEIARRRGFDEYKDDHRRGWGNRFNRS